MSKYKKVLVGLDLGSDSVGWCACDENGKIIKKNGKSLWGYLGFDEASDASERRGNRCQRRRYNRRQERIKLLRDIFNDEICNVDNSFFYRLDNSFYHNDDRDIPFEYTLFNDISYTDRQYYSEYPTIYHLRKHLVYSKDKADIRLIYLAIHNIIKYRGNFLNNMKEFHPMNEGDINNYFLELNQLLKEYFSEEHIELEYSKDIFYKLKEINETIKGISKKKEAINEVINNSKNKYIKDVIISLIVGGEVSVSKLGLSNIDGKEKEKLCAKKENFDELIDELREDNSSDEGLLDAFVVCKNIYEFFLLGQLLGREKYLCDAMVNRYNLHNTQLKELKNYVKKNMPNKYNEIFRMNDSKLNNYVAYIGSNLVNNEKDRKAHISSDEFYKYLKEVLNIKGYKGDDKYLLSIIELMDNGEYLLRQNSSNNGVFPYQLNKLELQTILEKQAKYYSFLTKDTINKIISILEFKIPYYVGPLISPKEDSERAKFSWIVKKNEEKIYPWNFNDVVDLDLTAKSFIQRMLNKCTYLKEHYCLPKNSILFSYFNVLMNLNKMNINGRPFTYEEKMDLIENLIKVKRKVSKKDILNYLIGKYGETDISISTSTNKEITNINCDMASYVDFVNIFGKDFVTYNIDLIENIINDITVFEDKNILEKRLLSEYNITNESVIKKIKGLNYTKYSSISKELLTDIVYHDIDSNTGEVYSSENIISVMEKTNQNLQEVLYDSKYNFIELIKEYNKNTLNENENNIKEYVDNIPFVSPGMKRPIIQAYKICEEIEKILGQRIDEYYVECTRTNKEKKGKATESRQKRLLDIYSEAIKTAKGEFKKYLEDMKNKISLEDANKFKSDKYYLYYIQLGKCMYTGRPIDISELNDEAHYNIDHIYPQSLIKDDSITNRVLVETSANQAKGDVYPIAHSILWNNNYDAARAYYKQLKDMGFMNEEKYKRLTANMLSETEINAFVNRQLVYTNQAVKGLINAIYDLKSNEGFTPKVVYSKGENVSDFRNKYDIVKSRNINNFHHAHDAYLNIMVGRTIDTYFNYFALKHGGEKYLKWMHDNGYTTNVMKIFDQNKNKKKDDILDSNSNLVWSYDKSLREIKKNIYNRFDIFSTERTYVGNELYGKVTILPAKVGNIAIKNSGPLANVDKYGGFKQYAFGSYSLICVDDSYIIEAIPTVYRNNPNGYLKTIYGDNYKIIIDILKQNTVIEKGKTKFVITGKTGDSWLLKNKNERIFSNEEIHIIKKIEKLDKMIEHNANGNETYEDINARGFLIDDNGLVVAQASKETNKSIILTNTECEIIYDCFINMLSKECFAFSASSGIKETLVTNKDKFISLSILGKTVILMNILDFLKTNQRKSVDLKLISGSPYAGIIVMPKKLKNCKIIYESITGFYRKVAFEIE